jgi:tRNA(Ser,Leu) C12 N-acetylase TAN1
MDLLVSHQRGRYRKARREILRTLKRLGDEHRAVERTEVQGIALAHTALDAREVVHRCRELFEQGFALDRRVELDHPDKVVRIDIVGEHAAVSILRPEDIFSSAAATDKSSVVPPPPRESSKSETLPSSTS